MFISEIHIYIYSPFEVTEIKNKHYFIQNICRKIGLEKIIHWKQISGLSRGAGG